MVQKWNLGDIVPPERTRRSGARPTPEYTQAAKAPQGDMRRRIDPAQNRAPLRTPLARDGRFREPHTEDSSASRESAQYDEVAEQSEMDSDIRNIKIEVGRVTRMRRYLLIGVVVAIAILIGTLVTITMTGADVTVKPKWKDVTVSAIIDAKQNGSTKEMGYELLTLKEEGERKVSATGQEKVSTKASGEITVINAHSSTKQRLIKNTRFESSDGKIFRIIDSIEIPGFSKNTSGVVVPGTAQAKVIADGPGDSYNIVPGRFTIPGLKGSEQYDKVYGETKSKMAGGYEGLKFIIDDGELSRARQELHLELREKLLARLASERPNGFVFFDPSVTFAYDSIPPTDAGDQAVTIKESVRLLAPLFKTDPFATYIADKTIAGYEGEPMRIDDASKLSFSYPATSTDFSSSDSLKFRLEGSVRLIWKYDMEKLRSDLMGIKETALPSVLSAYPAIDRSRVIIRPFWRDSFPADLEKIRIVEVMEMPQ